MHTNMIQFAVVREDPTIEEHIIRINSAKKILLIGSGGCTIFHLMNKFPDLDLTVVEPNPAQIELIEKKRFVLSQRSRNLSSLSVDNIAADSLNNCGNFESLFRQFRLFLFEFIMPEQAWFQVFEGTKNFQEIFSHKYWTVAFDLFFHDSLLRSMFGEAAVQHAPDGSYPVYFREVMERGLQASNRSQNYFLHHIFLGRYLPGAIPEYLNHQLPNRSWSYVKGLIQDVPSFASFDMITLSNIFDWCAETEVRDIAERVADESKPGVSVIFRQLNNGKNFRSFFKNFEFMDTSDLLRNDRSLFYSRIEVGVKR